MPTSRLRRRNIQVVHLLKALGLEMLLIDEMHHIVAGHERKQGHFLNTLKSLGNDLQIPLIGLGTMDALRAVQTDPQMTNRFEPLAIPKWTWDRDFRMLLASFERLVPLRRPSNLAGEQISKRLLALSEGAIGELSTLLNRAAAEALRSGREQIDCDVLSKTAYVSPWERRKHAEKAGERAVMRNAIAGTWPFRPSPYEDELLSSWVTRIALGHGLKLSAFLSIVGMETDPLTLDLDAAEDVLTFLAEKTGTERSKLLQLQTPLRKGFPRPPLPKCVRTGRTILPGLFGGGGVLSAHLAGLLHPGLQAPLQRARRLLWWLRRHCPVRGTGSGFRQDLGLPPLPD